MSNKNKNGSHEPRQETAYDPLSKVIVAATLLFIAGGAAIKGGFKLGERVADEVLWRRDQDIRRQERKERRERKEKLKEERRLKKEELKRGN